MSPATRPHPKNVPGPFYVELGCCTACDVPMQEAPGMFRYDDDNHCFVCRQPGNDTENTAMIGTAWIAELKCIRYRGSDPEVLRRFAELDLRGLCDTPPPNHIAPVIRNHVQFAVDGVPLIASAKQLAGEFQQYLVSLNNEWRLFKTKGLQATDQCVSLDFAWYENHFHTVKFHIAPNHTSDWHIECLLQHDLGDRGVSNIVSGWLTSLPSRYRNIKWYTDSDWRGSKHWQATVW